MIVSRLIDLQKLGGFHFNDSKFGDDDLDAGSINPYELFLIFNELTNATQSHKLKNVAYMIDQSHNVTDPIESLMLSANEIVNSYTKSLLVNYKNLEQAQDKHDPILAMQILKRAFSTDVNAIVAMARFENNNSIDPIALYRTLNYKNNKSKVRIAKTGSSSGIV
jgi:L-rhamnose isomerase/sugar isomerase